MEDEGITMLSGKETPIEVKIEDEFTGKIWPQYVTPYPVTNEYFLASAWAKESDTKIGMYMADIHNNFTLIHEEEKTAFIEPIPIKKRQLPAILPDRVDLEKTDATIYIQDIFEGDGLKDVPRDAVKELRVIAYDFGYIGSAGTDNIGISGPWEAMRILGTAPVEKDGSAIFKVPANTPIAFQPLDEDGAAVQLMRSWTTAMPGERLSCIGCHESGFTVPLPKASVASRKEPAELKPWYGPERGFDFEREVQPVLNRYCTGCHNQDHTLDLRAESHFPDYEGTKPGRLDFLRLHPHILEKYNGKVLFTPTYEKLISYIRRVNVADDVSMLEPGEYHANTSELIQILREGHQGVELDEESWSRLITWIDLNGPCHGTYQDIFNEPIPDNPNERRWELALAYGGPNINPDFIPEGPFYDDTPVLPNPDKKSEIEAFTKKFKRKKLKHRELKPGTGETLKLVNFGGDYWIGTHEITNAQFRQFDPSHSSRYYGKRHEGRADGKGLPLDESDQPAIRVSWDRAMAYCKWLSDKTGYQVTLPTEDQWELACMGGNKGFYHYKGKDFSSWENMADRTFTTFGFKGRSLDGHFVVGGDGCLIDAEGVKNADRRYNDGGCVTMPVGSYKPNGFGLYDMHGNAAEWTSTEYEYEARAGRSRHFQYVVKGGSFLDRPERAHVKVRHGYPSWQNVYNAGIRIVIND